MKLKLLLTLLLQTSCCCLLYAQNESADSAKLELLRKQSGVDPTRVQSRAGYSLLVQDQQDNKVSITNRVSLNLGVDKWAFQMKMESVTKSPEVGETGFASGFGDIRFNLLNAFFVKGKHAIAASAEFMIPTGGLRFGTGYFSVTPAITYSYTIQPSLFLAVQPQYTFDIAKDPIYPDLSIITIRSFLAKFTKTGYFFVFEPRPIFDLELHKTDFVISPIIGKSIGAGFNLIFLSEISLTSNRQDTQGQFYQLGFNKNF